MEIKKSGCYGSCLVVVYPTFSVATLVVISLVGILVFKESVDKKKMIALGLIILALFLLNI